MGRAGRAGGQGEGTSLLASPQLTSREGLGSQAPLGGHLISFHHQMDYPSVRVQRIKRKKRPHQRGGTMETGSGRELKASSQDHPWSAEAQPGEGLLRRLP